MCIFFSSSQLPGSSSEEDNFGASTSDYHYATADERDYDSETGVMNTEKGAQKAFVYDANEMTQECCAICTAPIAFTDVLQTAL